MYQNRTVRKIKIYDLIVLFGIISETNINICSNLGTLLTATREKASFWAGDTPWADILMTSVLVSVAGCTCSWHLCLFGFFGSCPTCWCHKLPSPTNWALTFYRPGHPDKWASNGPFLYWPEANGSSLFLTTQKCAFTQLQWTCLASKWASQTCVCLHAVVVGVE